MRKWIATSIAVTAACLMAGGAAAQSDEDKIEYRESVFTVIGGNFGPMGKMVEGKIDYDAERFARNADRVAYMSQMALEGFQGGPHEGDTHAKDAIWEQWDQFEQGMQKFQDASAELAEATAGGDAALSEVKGEFMDVARACKNCHDNFKAD